MWKWKLASFGRLGALRRTIKDEGHVYSSQASSQSKDSSDLSFSQSKDEGRSYSSSHANTLSKDEGRSYSSSHANTQSKDELHGRARSSTFLFWFNEVPGNFTPAPNALSPWVAPRSVCQLQNVSSLGAVIEGWKDDYDRRYRCSEEYSLRWGFADLVHYGALLAVGFNLVHQWKPAVVGFNVIEQRFSLEDPSQLCPVKAIKHVKTVQAQPLQSESIKNDFHRNFKDLVDVVPELGEKPGIKNKLEDEVSSSQNDTIEEIEKVLKDIGNDIHLEALNIQGVELIKTGNTREGIDMLSDSARKGNASAFFHLGNAYENGIGVAKDLVTAAKFYGIASSLGNAEASYNLAVFHLQGIGGLEESEEKAVELLTSSAEKGLKEAREALGLPVMEKEAEEGSLLGAELGCEDFLGRGIDAYLNPLFNLAASMESGITSVPQDSLFSLELYRMAADGGHVEARRAFLRLYSQLFEGLYENGDPGDKKAEFNLKHVASSPSLLYTGERQGYSIAERKTASCQDFGRLERRESQEDSGVEDQRVDLCYLKLNPILPLL